MNIVDTNVVSELSKQRPNAKALAWLENNMKHAYLTSITIYELRHGIQRLPSGKRKDAHLATLSDIRHIFSSRILGVGALEAEIAGDLRVQAEASGFNIATEDLLIAAIVKANNATLVTRNIRDFQSFSISLFNPFN